MSSWDSIPDLIDVLFSVQGLILASLSFLAAVLVFYAAFYRPARKVQVPRIRLLALLAVSVFNLIAVLPFIVFCVRPLKIYPLALWWLVSWLPFVVVSLSVPILIIGLIILRKWANFPATKERPVRSFFLLSVAFEAIYFVGTPALAFLESSIYLILF
jgi:hypothetical protein